MKSKRNLECIVLYLIIFSFLIYLLVPVVTTMNSSLYIKTGLIIVINIVSWATFGIAGILGGKKIFGKLKSDFYSRLRCKRK